MPHRRQPARHTRGLESSRVEIGEVVPQHLGFGAGKALAAAGQKFRKIGEVPAIGVERIGARALFRREHVEEERDQFGV